MRKIKFKVLVMLITIISINKYSLDIFADTVSSNTQNISVNNNTTILDGEIGEWDPTLNDKLDFSKHEVDGKIPNTVEYFRRFSCTILDNSSISFASIFSSNFGFCLSSFTLS